MTTTLTLAAPETASMIELRTLGVLDLRGGDGQEFRAVLQQPKRLALLAYLAVASRTRRFHRRDALLALFWPELDTDHARAALRRSLYFLRRSLGAEVIAARGDEEVGLAAERFVCDVTQFEAALDAGRPAEALELYRGSLLEGFYIGGAPEFERWLQSERERLHERASGAAWALADERAAAGDASGAAMWGRRAAALLPYDESAARRLIALLDRIGDRPAALRAYEELTRRLAADYEIEPSAETRALIEAIRTRPAPPPAAPAPRRASAPGPAETRPSQQQGDDAQARDAAADSAGVRIAVLPFTVRGSREVAYLGEGMVDLLSTKLDGAGDVRTVDPRALLNFVAREWEAEGADQERGRAVARRFGAGLFLLGTVIEAGGRLRIAASLYDAGGTLRATAEAAAGSEAGIFDMVDELARQVLAGQSAGPSARLTRLGALTTDSLSALKAYLKGECEFRAGRYYQALEAFQDAAAEDTTFALGHYRLAAAAAAVANLELAREAADQAFAHKGRLAAHDRLLLEAQRAWLHGDAATAERLYDDILATHVDDMEAWFLLGDVLFHRNPLRGRSSTEAREAFERALSYDPEHCSSLIHLARIAALEGRHDDLDTLVDRVLELSPAGDRALSMRALRAFALGNQIEKARVVASLGRARALAVGIAFTDITVYARDIAGAQQIARLFSKLTRDPQGKALCHIVLAHLELARGRRAAAWSELDDAAPHVPAWALETRALAAALPFLRTPRRDLESLREELRRWDAAAVPRDRNQVFAAHNDTHPVLRHYLLGLLDVRIEGSAAAEPHAEALDRMDALPEAAQALAADLALSLRAQAEHAAGRREEALALLEATRPERDVWYQLTIVSPFYARTLERYTRAELLRELGRHEEALGWYASIAERSPYELVYVAPAHLRQAEIHACLGREDEARHHRERFAELWKDCDPDLRGTLDAVKRRLEKAGHG